MEEDIKNEFKNIKDEFKDIKNEFKDIKDEFKNIKNEFKDIKNEFKDIKNEFDNIKSEFGSVKAELRDIKVEFNKRLDAHDKEFIKIHEEIATLTRSVLVMENNVVDIKRIFKDIWSVANEKPSRTELLCEDHEERIKTLEFCYKNLTRIK
jgi:predicted  nucleic acid-binding Zn-ribbon protein